jgi:hypothetical protein
MPRLERPLDAGDTPLLRFAAGLRALRAHAGNPTYRELSTLAHYSTAVLCDAAGGRKLPSKAVTLAFVAACDGDPSEWAARWREVADQLAPDRPPPSLESAPYPGLAAFQISDAARFFGREKLLAELLEHVRSHRFVGVFGASGSGKSSLLRAGLAAQASGPVVVMTPGVSPLEECAVRLGALTGDSAAMLHTEFAADPGNLHLRISQALADSSEDLLLIVDQFEEIFTLGADSGPFIEALVHAATTERSRVRVVLGVRADFFGHCGSVPALRDALRDRTVLVGAMTPDELREAVTRPAAEVGLTVETALVTRIIADAGKESGALPLVSHALRETWQRRQGIALTLAAYEAAGGIQHAIARTAEAVFTHLDPAQQAAARQVFLRLVAISDEDTKRRLRRAELDAGDSAVLAALTASRLVTVGQDHVEITHEALISHWPRLRDWLGEDRDGLRTHRLLTDAAAEWTALDRDPGSLYRGTRLALAQDWSQRSDVRLCADERAFLDASTHATRRQSRRLRRLVALLVALLVAVSGTTVYSVIQQHSTADALRRVALQKVEDEVRSDSPGDPSVVAALAVADYRLDPTPQHRGQLLRWSGIPASVPAARSSAVFSATGTFAASVDGMGKITLLAGPDLKPGKELPARGARVRSIAVAPNGRHVAVSYEDGETALWDTSPSSGPRLVRTWTGRQTYVAFNGDGTGLAIGDVVSGPSNGTSTNSRLELWNVDEPRRDQPMKTLTEPWSQTAFAADAPRAVVRASAPGALTWNDPTNPATARNELEAVSLPVAEAQSDRFVLVATPSEFARGPASLFDVAPDGKADQDQPLSSRVNLQFQPLFNRDGSLAVLPDGTNGVAVWDVHHPQQYAALSGWPGQVLAAAITPDGRLAVITTETQLVVPLDVEPAIAGICRGLVTPLRQHVQAEWSSYFPDMDVPYPCPEWP